MKSLKDILNQKFSLLAFVILAVILIFEILHLATTIEFHKKQANETSRIFADYFESTLLFESTPDFEKFARKLDFKHKYYGITIYRVDGSLFAAKGEKISEFRGSKSIFKNSRLLTRVTINTNKEKIGTLYMSFNIGFLINDLIRSSIFLIGALIGVSLFFYIYVRQINSIVISPINKFTDAIHQYESEEFINLNEVKISIKEIDNLKNDFLQMMLLVDYSKRNLELLNETLERKVVDKTEKLSFALEETKKYQKQLVAQEKLASLGSLSAGIAHEIKNPLNIIINSSRLLMDSVKNLKQALKSNQDLLQRDGLAEALEDMEDLMKFCTMITSSGERADRIIKSMLTQARSESSKRQEYNISEICEQGLNLALHAMKAKQSLANVDIINQIGKNIFLNCYYEELERALINLIDNSFDSLAQKIHIYPDFKPCLEVSVYEEENYVKIFVKDNGMGIPKEIIDKIKEPFFTTKEAGRGTGLGLSMINDIVTAQGGDFIIESVEGVYSKMILQLIK